MQISKKAIYAIRALIYVAAFKGKRLCTITEISEHENVPREYLAKILKELSQKGLLTSFKGVKGGYRLAKPAGEITFTDILEAVQEPFSSLKESDENNRSNVYHGASFQFWYDLHQTVKDKLNKMSLNKINYKKFYSVEAAEE
jgi:Rrf2 family protein